MQETTGTVGDITKGAQTGRFKYKMRKLDF